MLNQDQINQYHEQGFTVFHDFLDSKQVQEFKEETESLTSGNTLKIMMSPKWKWKQIKVQKEPKFAGFMNPAPIIRFSEIIQNLPKCLNALSLL